MTPVDGSASLLALRRLTAVILAAVVAAVLLAAGQVPAAAAPPPDGGDGTDEPCTSRLGPYQREMEEYLGLPVDGRQSEDDCRAIRAFQREHGIEPADGYAGVPTWRTMLVEEARANPNELGACPTAEGKVACVDLTRQLMWVQQGHAGRVIMDPVPVRTGRQGLETRLGWHRIYLRKRDHYSTIYDNAPMPFSQFFNGGQAFHGTYDDLYESGSGGCVNMTLPDAETLWHTINMGDRVFVYGRKPGT
ncbi:L,D-transpeptidase family protein [Streptomyces sodiiphilus]|uniref:L,D-transpeptidase family protein n=1 Tax=Streptomyces sodiiphilus TaxID=226217 RepID=A0ABN2PQA7_9ACTN